VSVNFSPIVPFSYGETKKCNKPCEQDKDCKTPKKAEKQKYEFSIPERLALTSMWLQNMNPPIDPGTGFYTPQMIVPPMVDPGNPGGIWA